MLQLYDGMSSDNEFEPVPPKHRRLGSSPTCMTTDFVRSKSPSSSIKRDSDSWMEDSDVLKARATPWERGECDWENHCGQKYTENSVIDDDPDSMTSEATLENRNDANNDEASSSSAVFEADATGTQTETCPICLLPFVNQEVATPSVCNHRYCFTCLMEWTETINTCPVDRKVFDSMNVRPKFGSKVTRLVPVETRSRPDDDESDWERDYWPDYSYLEAGEWEEEEQLSYSDQEAADRQFRQATYPVDFALTWPSESAEDWFSDAKYSSDDDSEIISYGCPDYVDMSSDAIITLS